MYKTVQLKKLATCRRCSRKGHFAAVCFSRTIAVLSQEELEPAETSYLDAITNGGNKKETKSWYIQFQIDKMSALRLTPELKSQPYQRMCLKPWDNLIYRNPLRYCVDQTKALKVLGCTTVQLTYKQISIKHCVYVIQHLSNNLLGLSSITTLSILTKVDDIQSRENAIISKFQDLFQGLGKMPVSMTRCKTLLTFYSLKYSHLPT